MASQSIDPITLIAERIARYPNVDFKRFAKGCKIGVPNDGGFKIELLLDNDGWVVYFGDSGLHEHFEDPNEALEFVAFGLSDRCRLREIRMPFLQRSFVEKNSENGWESVFEAGFFKLPFPIRKDECIFQNRLISG